MSLVKQTYLIATFLFLPVFGYGFYFDINKKLSVIDTYNQKLKGDSILAVKVLDSAKVAFYNHNYNQSIGLAQQSYELARNIAQEDFKVESMLLLARNYKQIHLEEGTESAFNNTLKYYLKAITILESANSNILLPDIYIEYGDFYASLNLPKLTVENYEKAYDIIRKGNAYEVKKNLLNQIARIHYQTGNLSAALESYVILANLYFHRKAEVEYISTLETLSSLYRENKDFDNALINAKKVLAYYEDNNDLTMQIAYLNIIGDISYEAVNNFQARDSFSAYLELLKKNPDELEKEIESLRYVKTLIKLGEIYKSSTDHGYLSDYEYAIRYFNKAHKFTDSEKNPGLAADILHQTGEIYFNGKDYKTCLTYLNLALYYAQKDHDLNAISENYILLARAFNAVDKRKEATINYELHASYKDSLLLQNKQQRQMIQASTVNQRLDNLRVQEILDRIETRERQELTLAEKELRNVALKRDLENSRQDAKLNEALLQNHLLAEDSAKRRNMLTVQQLENDRSQQRIDSLNSEYEKQELILENQQADQQNKRQRIKILEQENSLAKSKLAYYVLSIIMISLVLIFIIVVYIQKRRANRVLKGQNEKIELQTERLQEAYQNLELLSTIGRDITASLIIEEIIETVYANLNTLMDAAVFGIGVFDAKENRLHFPGVIEKNERLKDIFISLDNNHTLAAWSFSKQKELSIRNYHQEYENYISPENKPYPGDGNSSSIIYMPLTIGSKKLGVLTVQSFSENAFDEYQINIVRNIAIYAKIALENASVYTELERKSKSLIHANKNIKEQNKLIEEQYQELLSINEEKNNLMKILAHDLRNPLATAMSMTELVRYEKENLSAEQYQASEIIWRGLKRMNDMIRKILDIKAAESQKVYLEFDHVNVNEILGPIERDFNNEAAQKQIKLHLVSESEDLLIRVDRNYFNQIIENLVSNAIKFTPSHKNVYVILTENKDHVRVTVKDEGPGIPENEMSQLFKKYQKLSTKPTAGEQSIGLGLSIVKKYSEVMDGKVWCESKVGVGTEFIVEFKKIGVAVS